MLEILLNYSRNLHDQLSGNFVEDNSRIVLHSFGKMLVLSESHENKFIQVTL